MRDRANGQPRFLGVLCDEHAQRGGVLQRPAHDQRVVHADAVVGEHPHLARTRGHHAHLGELRARETDGDRSDGMDVDEADLLTAMPHVVGDHRTVGDGTGVGHREDRGVSTECRCGRAGFDVLGVLPARLPQVGVQVDEARQQDLSAGVDHLGVVGRRQVGADVADLTVGDEHVDRVALAVAAHTADQYRLRHALIASRSDPTNKWNSTAIRT